MRRTPAILIVLTAGLTATAGSRAEDIIELVEPVLVEPDLPEHAPVAVAEEAGADPPADDPNADYVITWHSLTTSAQVGVADGAVNAQITLQGALQIPPTRQPAAYIVEVANVIDHRGRSLVSAKLGRWSGRTQQFAVQRINNQQANQNQWGIAANLSNLVGFSTTIDRIEGKLYLLEVTATRDADLELAPAQQFTDLGGGVAVKIDKVDRRSNSLTVNYNVNSPQPGALNDLGAPPFLYKQELLDEAGRLIPIASTYSSMNGENQGYIRMYMQNAEDAPAKLRLVLAVEVEERIIDFTLNDLHINPPDKPEPEKNHNPDADAPAPAPAPDPAPAPAVKPQPRGIDGQRF